MGGQKTSTYYLFLFFFLITLIFIKSSMLILIGRHLLNQALPLFLLFLYSPELILFLIGLIIVNKQLHFITVFVFNFIVILKLFTLRYIDVFLTHLTLKEVMYTLINLQDLVISSSYFFQWYFFILLAFSVILLNSTFLLSKIEFFEKFGTSIYQHLHHIKTRSIMIIIFLIILINLCFRNWIKPCIYSKHGFA